MIFLQPPMRPASAGRRFGAGGGRSKAQQDKRTRRHVAKESWVGGMQIRRLMNDEGRCLLAMPPGGSSCSKKAAPALAWGLPPAIFVGEGLRMCTGRSSMIADRNDLRRDTIVLVVWRMHLHVHGRCCGDAGRRADDQRRQRQLVRPACSNNVTAKGPDVLGRRGEWG